ncbi:MAG: hypothetical protein IIA27_10430 [Gemmatimonadetes bacterium]|nr:hypothetical protein [Gemmatimonadota bacterium]
MLDTTVTLQLRHGSHRLVLEKSGHRWVLQWDPGLEHALIGHVAAMARDPHCPLGWVEAALVCRYLGRPSPTGRPASTRPSHRPK